MPDFYAHQVFGSMLFRELDLPLLRTEREGWLCGLYGPDPLFFYPSITDHEIAEEGHALHRESPKAALLRLEKMRDRPFVKGYAAGYYCHYLLDSALHPLVNCAAKVRGLSHTMLENYFDRSLMGIRDTGKAIGRTDHLTVCRAASCAYTRTDCYEYRQALNAFCNISDTAAAVRRHSRIPARYLPFCNDLKQAMLKEVPHAAQQLQRFLEAFSAGEPLDFIPDTDFMGQTVTPQG